MQEARAMTGSCLAAALVACASSCVSGQCVARPTYAADLIPVHQGCEDVSPLGRSLECPRTDFRAPADFERVYRSPQQDGRFYRIEGGLVASFPESIYVHGDNGRRPIVPPGTVFSIGIPTSTPESASPRPAGAIEACSAPCHVQLVMWPLAEAVSHPVGGMVSQPVSLAAPTVSVREQDPPRTFELSVEYYRRARLKEIAARYGPR